MKSLLKVFGLFAICMVASFQLISCSSSDDEEVIEQQKKFDVTGKWMMMIAQPIDEDMSYEEIKDFAISFQTPFIEFGAGGKLRWFELDQATGDPIKIEHVGTYAVKDDKITINAPGSKWMSGTHTIESLEKINGQLLMEWIVVTDKGKGRFIFSPTIYTNL